MRFGFTDDQVDFGQFVSELLAKEFTASDLRRQWEDPVEGRLQVWRSLAVTGVCGLLAPEAQDGGGARPVDSALVMEATGRACLAAPVVETVLMAPLLLSWAQHSPAHDDLLAGIARGDTWVTSSLGGDPHLVPFGLSADAVIHREEDRIYLVPAEYVSGLAVKSVDPTRELAQVTWDLAELEPVAVGADAVDELIAAGAAGTASQLVGLSDHLLEITREFVMQRTQFGVPIGSFQALKHRLATAAVKIEAARSLTWNALYRSGTPDAVSAAAMAKAAANEAAATMGYAALQCHGGIGFTWEHDLHLWLQRGRVWEVAYGTTATHRERLGAERLQARAARAVGEEAR